MSRASPSLGLARLGHDSAQLSSVSSSSSDPIRQSSCVANILFPAASILMICTLHPRLHQPFMKFILSHPLFLLPLHLYPLRLQEQRIPQIKLEKKSL